MRKPTQVDYKFLITNCIQTLFPKSKDAKVIVPPLKLKKLEKNK